MRKERVATSHPRDEELAPAMGQHRAANVAST